MMVLEWKVGANLNQLEQDAILATLNFHRGNRTHTAKTLGISVRTLRNKINLYKAKGLFVPDSQYQRTPTLEEELLRDLEDEMEIKKPVVSGKSIIETDGPMKVRFTMQDPRVPARLELTVGKVYVVHRVTGHKRPRYHVINDSGKESSYRDYSFEYVSGNIIKPARYSNYLSSGIDAEDFKLDPARLKQWVSPTISPATQALDLDQDSVTADDIKQAEQAKPDPYCKKHFYTFPCKLCK